MKSYVLRKPDLEGWIEGLIRQNEVIAPVKHENFTQFSPIKSAPEIVWGAPQTVIPPKTCFYPQSEELLSYDLPGGRPQAQNAVKPRILFGVHPCDLNAIYI